MRVYLTGPIGWKQSLVNAVYPFCYYIGIRTVRFFRIVWRRFLLRFLQKLARFFLALWQVLVLRPIDRFYVERRKRGNQLKKERNRLKALWQSDRIAAAVQWVCYPFKAAWAYRRIWGTGFNYLAPIAAVCAMAITIHQFTSATYALYVSYQGQEIGYVADETVVEAGLTLAKSRIAPIDDDLGLSTDTPEFSIRTASTGMLLDHRAVCDALLKAYGDEVGYLTGVYVDGKLVGALKTKQQAQKLLDEILEEARTDSAKEETLSFKETVEILPGLYPAVSELSPERMKELLTDHTLLDETYKVQQGDTLVSIAREHGIDRLTLLQNNPDLSEQTLTPGQTVLIRPSYAYLHILSTRTEVIITYLPYETMTVKDYNRVLGDNYVKVQGQLGEIETTYQVVTVDGEEVSRTALSEVQTKKPVTQINAQGAMNLGYGSGVAGDGITTGRFIWPIPGWYLVTYGYGQREDGFHRGIDIYQHGIYGAGIVAVDGGTVVKVNDTSRYGTGWSSGYGFAVVIDHGNGYTSWYTHCSAVMVSVGQKVSQGELIAYVGETGRTTGPGMHFEIQRYGTAIDPMPLLHR